MRPPHFDSRKALASARPTPSLDSLAAPGLSQEGAEWIEVDPDPQSPSVTARRPANKGRSPLDMMSSSSSSPSASAASMQRPSQLPRVDALPPMNAEHLHKVLDVHMNTGRWKEAIDTLRLLAAQEQDPKRKSGILLSAANLVRDELQRPDLALADFEASLDAYPHQLKAFESIDKILTQRRNWALLERAYRKMIFRLPKEGGNGEDQDLLVTLWRNLGEIYRTRIGDFGKAAIAFESASRLAPQDTQLQTICQELRQRIAQEAAPPKQPVDARQVDRMLAEITQSPASTRAYQALYQHYLNAGDNTRACAVAGALVALRRADPAQAYFFEQQRPACYLNPQRRPTAQEFETWVRHPDQDPTLTAIFQLAAPAVGSLFARQPQDIAQMREAWPTQDKARHGHIMEAMEYATAVLGVVEPRLYVNERQAGGVELLALRDGFACVPVVIAHSELMHTHDASTLAFASVQGLAQLSPAYFSYLATGKSLEGLRALFMACLSVAGLAPQGKNSLQDQLANRLRERVAPDSLRDLCALTEHYAGAHANRPVDLKQWIAAMQMTLNRWAFLMSGDLPKAINYVASISEQGYMPVSKKQRLQDIVLYSISEQYRNVCQAIGLD